MAAMQAAGNASDMADSGAVRVTVSPSHFEHDDRSDADNAAHRLRAVREHRARALRQILDSSLIVMLASLAPLFWFLVPKSVLDGNGTGIAGSHGDILIAVVPALAALATVIFGLWLLWYRRENDKDWSENSAKADAREPRQSADGYMQLFRRYAKTKRRATFTMSYGVLSAWWALLGILAAILLPFAVPTQAMVLAASSVQMLAAFFVIYIGFDIGRRYLPGNVLVTKTLILSFLATTSQTAYQEAWDQSRKVENEIIDEKPWWFYSYRVPRKARK